MMPLLVGLDGVKKMSKSAGNYIGVHDAPNDMFGKIMSISDDLMWNYYELLSERSLKEIEEFKSGIAAGTVNAASISPREIFIGAMKNRAVRIAMLHNHPSGDPSLSIQDIDLTDRVNRAGKFLDIKLIDHIIIGDRRYYSFAENKLLDINY